MSPNNTKRISLFLTYLIFCLPIAIAQELKPQVAASQLPNAVSLSQIIASENDDKKDDEVIAVNSQDNSQITQDNLQGDANSCTSSDRISLNTRYRAKIDYANDVDWFEFYPPGDGVLSVTLEVPSDKDYDLELYSSCFASYECKSNNGAGLNEQCTKNPNSGAYRAKVYGYSASDYSASKDYYITASFTPAQKPDLVPYTFIVSPINPTDSDSISITYNTENTGNANAGYFESQFFIDDVFYQTCQFQSGLASGYYSGCKKENIRLTAGSHTLKMIADSAYHLAESNENNNLKTQTLPVAVTAKPDLVPYTFIVSPINPTDSDSISITYNTENAGNANAGYFESQFFIDDVFYQTCQFQSGLSSGYYNGCKKENIHLSAGSHTLKMIADSAYHLAESNENNNLKTQSLPVSTASRSYDFFIRNIYTTPTEVYQDQQFNITYEIEDFFNSNTPPYISTLKINDVLSLTCTSSGIKAGYIDICTKKDVILTSGTYKVAAYADSVYQVSETNENNNEKAGYITVKSRQTTPDLIIDDLWQDGELVSGKQGIINVRIKNSGSGTAAQSTLGLYLDGSLDNTYAVPPISPGESVAQSYRFVETISAGLHTLKFKADMFNALVEQSESNNEREESFVWGTGQVCIIPDGTSAACDCNSFADCPQSHPYCEEMYPSPISDGPDACRQTPPLYCGDGLCNAGETSVNCPSDCRPTTNAITVTVNNANTNLPQTGAKVLFNDQLKGTTDHYGKLRIPVSQYTSWNIKIHCPNSQFCTSSSAYLNNYDIERSFSCPCGTEYDKDGDSFGDADEEIVGTDPNDKNSNLATEVYSNNLMSCFDFKALFSGIFSEQEQLSLWNSMQSLNQDTIMTLTQTPTTQDVMSILGNADINRSKLASNSRTVLTMLDQSEEVKAFSSGPNVIIMMYDQESGITSIFTYGASCSGQIIGTLYGGGQGAYDDIKGIADLAALVLKGLWNALTNRNAFTEAAEGLKSFIAGLGQLLSNIDGVLYGVSMDIFKKGRGLLEFFGLRVGENLDRPTYHAFQMGFFQGFIQGYVVEQILLSAIVVAKAISLFSAGVKLGGSVSKAAMKVVSKVVEKFGNNAGKIISESKFVSTFGRWSNEIAVAGAGRFASYGSTTADFERMVARVGDCEICFQRLEEVAREIGDARAKSMFTSTIGFDALRSWTKTDLLKLEKLMQQLSGSDLERILEVTNKHVDDLKSAAEFYETFGMRVPRKFEWYQFTQKIVEHPNAVMLFSEIETLFGGEVLRRVLLSADDYVGVIKGADVISKSSGKTISNLAPQITNAEKKAIFVKDIGITASMNAETAKTLVDISEITGVEQLAKHTKTGKAGFAFEAKVAKTLRNKGYNIQEISKEIQTTLGDTDIDELMKNGDIWEAKSTGWNKLERNDPLKWEKTIKYDWEPKIEKLKEFNKMNSPNAKIIFVFDGPLTDDLKIFFNSKGVDAKVIIGNEVLPG